MGASDCASVLRSRASESQAARPGFLPPPTRMEADVVGLTHQLTKLIILALGLGF
jgi:hypothetical protein